MQARQNALLVSQRRRARAKYLQVFADFPQNRARLVNRICVGNTVIDHEDVSRGPDGPSFQVIAIYTLAGGKIARVDFVK